MMSLTGFNFSHSIISSSTPFPFSGFKISCSTTQLHVSSSPLTKTPLKQIQNSGVIAGLRANSAELALRAARAAISGGISVLEIVMSTPGVLEVVRVLRCLVEEHPTMTLGVGTVLNVEDAKNATNAGAKFLMSPATIKDIMDDVQVGDVLYIPGVMTPTEILSAHDAGAEIVKVYPVSALGGTNYISALKRPFPHIPMVASQGIMIDSIGEYIARGATAVVLSDAIFNKEAMGQNNFELIYQLACLAALKGKAAIERYMQEEKVHAILRRYMPEYLLYTWCIHSLHLHHLHRTAFSKNNGLTREKPARESGETQSS